MDRDLRLVWLYCVIEDAVRQILGETRLRSRGPTPALTDVEALTIEIFGETLGLNSDASIWRYACDHLRDWFPGLGTEWNFVRRCANLSWLKARVQDALFHPSGDWNAFSSPAGVQVRTVETGQAVPGRLVRLRRQAGEVLRLQGRSADELGRGDLPVVAGPANTDEREMLDAAVSAMSGLLFADKGLISADLPTSWPGAVST